MDAKAAEERQNHLNLSTHAMYFIDAEGRATRLGAQVFARSEQASPEIAQQLYQILPDRSFEVGGKKCFALCCGEINLLAGRDDVQFRFGEAAPAIAAADIVLNPTHDRMGNAGTVLAKREFLSSLGNRSRAYVSASNWNLKTRSGAQRQDSRTLHSVFVNGNELEMSRVAHSADRYEYREAQI
jgi:hypothetical protein